MVAKTVSTPLVALIILYFRQVDNFLYSFRTKESLHKVGFEIDKVMTAHNLHLQLPFSTTQQDHYNFEVDHCNEVVLGCEWDKVLDQLLPHTVISHKRGFQGKKGILLTDQESTPEKMTKRIVLSVLSMLYDPLGVFYSILKITMKALFSQLCILVPGKTRQSFDQPIMQQCPELAHLCCQLCNQLTDLDKILPLQRYAVPDRFQVQHMVACKDGSSIGHSATLHLVSRNENEFHSRIVRANNRIKISAAPSNGSLGYPLVLHLVQAYMQATYHMYCKDLQELPIYVVGDSQSALQSLKGSSRDILLRSVFSESADLCLTITNKFPKASLRFIWLVE